MAFRAWVFIRAALPKMAAALMVSSPSLATAQQSLYWEGPHEWFVYRESKSCVLYHDTVKGTMLRFSDRTDENRTYFSAFNPAWGLLSPRLGQSLTIYLNFPELKRGVGSAGLVVENTNGELGITGNSFDIENLNRLLSTEKVLRISAMFDGDSKPAEVESLDMSGAAAAIIQLVECTESRQ